MKNKIYTLLLILVLVFSSTFYCFGISQKTVEIEIKDIRDFLLLEEYCRIDQYSLNKKFVLTRDIDFEGKTIDGLASFSGNFDGRGHTIRNFTFSNQSEVSGLFRYIEKNGIVSNLKIDTKISADNPSTIIGGIAGINYGLIDNCEFLGTLKSSKTLGGIVGSNTQTGVIKNSVNRASLISVERIGGIAGENFGKIYSCKNIGKINTESSWVDEKDDIDIEKLIDFSVDYQSGKNIGGITGYNEGLIERSTNNGSVGYFRSGDNVGGIAGYQEGQIKDCINNGEVFGKNDVGGIVGQLSPCIEETKHNDVQLQIQRLHDILNKTIDDFAVFSDTLGDDVSDLTKEADIALKTADALTDELINVTNGNIDTLNDLADRIDYISNHLPSVTKEISASLRSFRRVNDDFQKIKDDAPVLTEEDQSTLDGASDRIERNADILAQTTSHAAILYEDIYDILTDSEGNTKDYSDLSKDEKNELKNLSKNLIDDLIDAGNTATDMIFDLLLITNTVGPYLEDSIEAWDNDFENLFADIDDLISHLQKATDNTTRILDYCNKLDDLRAQNFSSSFSQKTKELSETLSLVNSILVRLNDNTTANAKSIENDMYNVNDQLNILLNSVIEYVDSLEKLINGDIYNDLSYSSRDYSAASKITGSTNAGVIDGCKNIGGIAGNMDIEAISSIENAELSLGHEYDIYVIIKECVNTGFVSVKNLNGGGIVGCAAKGYISDCFSSGIIEGENASYLGGIAGISNLRIDLSNSMSELNGKEYIGGIAGTAEEIHGCMSLARITKCEGRSGAILGAYMPTISEKNQSYRSIMNKRLSNNYFCSKNLYGIDGVSYVSCAEPLSYADLCIKENAPDEFKNLKIIFLNPNNKIVRELPVEYGEYLTDISYPEIESESGKYVVWSDLYSNTVDGNILVRSKYLDYVTVVASDYTISGRPAGYVGGNFEDSVSFIVKKSAHLAPDFLDKKSIVHLYVVELSGKNINSFSVSTLRLYLGDTNRGKAYCLQNNSWEEVPCTKNGSYLELDMQGNYNVFCVAEDNTTNLMLVVVCSISLILIICFIVVMTKRSKKSRH